MALSIQWDFLQGTDTQQATLNIPFLWRAIKAIIKAVTQPFLDWVFQHLLGLIYKSYKLLKLFLRIYLFNIPTQQNTTINQTENIWSVGRD